MTDIDAGVKPPWRQGPLAEWEILRMNHFRSNGSQGSKMLCVVMVKGSRFIIEEGLDDKYLWNRLIHQALKKLKVDHLAGVGKQIGGEMKNLMPLLGAVREFLAALDSGCDISSETVERKILLLRVASENAPEIRSSGGYGGGGNTNDP